MSGDERSWHVLALDEDGEVVACLRYMEAGGDTGFDGMRVRQSALACCPHKGPGFRRAVEREMARARQHSVGFGEVGGWAVREDRRLTPDSLRIVLATYGLLELLGGCTGLATATMRHGSAEILQRIGLSGMQSEGQDIPPYYDAQYDCMMQMLWFDSRFPNPKYRATVEELMEELAATPAVVEPQYAPALSLAWRLPDSLRFAPDLEHAGRRA